YRAAGGTTAISVDNDSVSGYPVAQAVQFRFGGSGVLGGIYHQTDAGSSPWWLRFKAWNGSAEQERMCINGPSGNVGIGSTNPRSRLSIIPSADATTSGGAAYLTIGETTNNLQYQLGLGYYPDLSAGYVGVIQAIQANAGSRLIINPGGGHVGINKYVPVYPLDVAGDVNIPAGNGFRVGGVAISQIVATSVNGAGLNTVYQNTQGKPMFVNITASVNAGQYVQLLVDAGNPPAFVVCAASNPAGVSSTLTVSGWVMPGHYFKAVTSGATFVSSMQWY